MTYETIARTSDRIKETNDCAVTAVALVLGVSYEVVHEAMEIAGRAYREGTPRHITEKVIKNLGFSIRRQYSAEQLGLEVGQRRPRTSDAAKNPASWEHLPNLLIFVPQHAVAFVNGKMEDWTKDRMAPIECAWEIERPLPSVKLGQEPPPIIFLGDG